MEIPTIHVFGNPDIAMDSVPLRLLPQLFAEFHETHFVVLDPNEEWDIPDPFVLFDTVVGIAEVHVFHSLDEFNASPAISVHDFDALFNLRYLAKLGKLKRCIIIGVPPDANETDVFPKIVSAMRETLSPISENSKTQQPNS